MDGLAVPDYQCDTYTLSGIVQGVGMRPAIYRLAIAAGLDGYVLNRGGQVRAVVGGDLRRLEAFGRDLLTALPPAARIHSLHVVRGSPTSQGAEPADPLLVPGKGFSILPGVVASHVNLPDVATSGVVAPDMAALPGKANSVATEPPALAAKVKKHEAAWTKLTNPEAATRDTGSGAWRATERSVPSQDIQPGLPAPDLPVCPACLAELFTPGNPRQGYPFIQCVDCGPRHTQISGLPYERNRSGLRDFPLCRSCQNEFDSPSERRFHAENLCCPHCGPRLWLEIVGPVGLAYPAHAPGRPQTLAPSPPSCAATDRVRVQPAPGAITDPTALWPRLGAAIRGGRIVALQGIGGFHLVCDARQSASVWTLRQRKQRPTKPFAVLMLNTASVWQVTGMTVDDPRRPCVEKALLDASRPVVLVPVAGAVAHSGDRTTLAQGALAADAGLREEPVCTEQAAWLGAVAPGIRCRDGGRAGIRTVDGAEVVVGADTVGGADRAYETGVGHGDANDRPSRYTEYPAECLGVMLPSTPLQYLLFHELLGRPEGLAWLQQPAPLVLVCTSANRSGAPLIHDPVQARSELHGIADLLVMHDRPILFPCDDGVVKPTVPIPVIRPGRGMAPMTLTLPTGGPSVLALGGHLKTTVALSAGTQVVVSPFVGDLDHPDTCARLEATAHHLLEITGIRPAVIACDLSPDTFSHRLAKRMAREMNIPCLTIQHHHAHLAAVLAEWPELHGERVLGVALDGHGEGDDGSSWGGEIFLTRAAGSRRLGHLRPLPLPGGEAAIRDLRRLALGFAAAVGKPLPPHLVAPVDLLQKIILQGPVERWPHTSSCGRWFDLAAVHCGVAPRVNQEGEAAMALETLALAAQQRVSGSTANTSVTNRKRVGEHPGNAAKPARQHARRGSATTSGGINHSHWLSTCRARIDDQGLLDLSPVVVGLATVSDGAEAAWLFHEALAAGLCRWIAHHARSEGLDRVVLGGGCLVNRWLAEDLVQRLREQGIMAYTNRQLPCNDSALSVGQAWAAMHGLAPGRPL